MSKESLREALEGLRPQMTASFDKVIPDVETRVQIVGCILAALTAHPVGVELGFDDALNKIAPFLEGVPDAHLRAVQIVSALSPPQPKEQVGERVSREQCPCVCHSDCPQGAGQCFDGKCQICYQDAGLVWATPRRTRSDG